MGYNIGPTIAVKGEKEYATAMKNIRAEMKQVKAAAEAATSAYSANDRSIKALVTRNNELKKAYDVQEKAVKAAEDVLARYRENGIDPTSKAYKDMETNLNYAKAALNRTARELEENGNVMKRVGENAELAGKKIKSAGDKISSIGGKLTLGLTTPIVAAGTAITNMAMDFENAMAKVSTLAGDADMQSLANGIIDVSNATGQAASGLAEAQYQAISAGIDVKKSAEFVEIATKTAVGGFTSAETAVDGLTTVLNAYGIAAENAGQIANQFLITQNLGKTTVDELAKSIGQVAPTAKAAGVSTDELMSSLAALTANGIQTSSATTGLKAALSNIIKPTSEAQKLAEQLGIDFSVTALNAQGLSGFLDTLSEATGGNLEVMGKLFGSTEALNTVLTLTSDEGAALFGEAMQEMKTNTTAVDDAFNKISGTSSYKLHTAINKVKNAGITLGEKLTPIVEKIAEGVEKLAQKFGSLTDEQQKTILKIAGVVAAAGPLLTVIGKMTSVVGSAVSGFGKLVQSLSSAGTIGAAAAGPGGWIALAATAFAGLATVVVTQAVSAYREFHQEALNLRDATNDANQAMQDINATYDNTVGSAGAATDVAMSLVDKLDELNNMPSSPAVMTEYRATVDALNEVIPGLNIQIDEQTGKIAGSTDAIRDQISAWQELAIAQAMQDKMSALMSEYGSLLIDVQMAQNTLTQNEQREVEIKSELTQKYDELRSMTGMTYEEFLKYVGSLHKGQTVQNQFGDAVNDTYLAIVGLKTEEGGLASQNEKLREEIAKGEESLTGYRDEVSNLQGAMEGLASGAESAGYAAGSAYGDGLVRGLKSRTDAVIGASMGLANNMSGMVNARLEIASPSRVAKRQGMYYGEGLVVGLRESMKSVRTAAANIADAVVAVPGSAAAKTASGGVTSPTTINLTVTDPSPAYMDYLFNKFNVKLGAMV